VEFIFFTLGSTFGLGLGWVWGKSSKIHPPIFNEKKLNRILSDTKREREKFALISQRWAWVDNGKTMR